MNQLFKPSAAREADRDSDAEFGVSSPAMQTPQGAGAGAEQAFFRLDVRRSLEQHGRLARNVALGFVALAVLYVLAQIFLFRSWPNYISESTVYVQPTPAKVLPSAGGAARWPYDGNTYESYIHQQMMNVSREDVLIAAVHKLGSFARPGESDQAAAQRLVRALEVARAGDAQDFTIGARAKNPVLAAAMANAVTSAYIESSLRDEHSGDAQRLAALKEEEDRIGKALAADHAEQDALNRQLGVASVAGATPDHYDEDITTIRAELARARTAHDIAAQKFASLDPSHGNSSAAINAEAEEAIASDPGLASMKQSLNARRAALISQMANLTPANPQYKQDEAELVNINTDLGAKIADLRAQAAMRIRLRLSADLRQAWGVESQLNGQLRQLVGAATSATPKMQRSGDLVADITRLQARYVAVDEQLHNLLLEDGAPAAAFQVTPALAPLGRTKSGVLRNALLIALAGGFFGLLAAIIANRLDPRIYIAADVERLLGFAPLAQLPDFNEVSEGVAEEYLLRLAAAIEHARKQGALKNCIFTGAAPGTGVSTLVNRVRAMLEAMGRSTVLVDATGAHAPDSRQLTAGSNGTSERESGLMSGPRVSRPTALLQQMAEETQTGDESLVLTDTAPLTVSAETEYLARFVDCAIVVIESGVTTRAQLRETAAMLQRLGATSVGFVLNRVALATADPAFRTSVDAVEKHLQAQNSPAPERSEMPVRLTPPQTPAKEAQSTQSTPRTKFEKEVAAAGAAVARFSAPPVPEPVSASAVSMAPPLVSAPVAEAAKRFSLPLVTLAAAEAVTAASLKSAVEPTPAALSPKTADPVVEAPEPVVAAAAPEPTAPEPAIVEPASAEPAMPEPVAQAAPLPASSPFAAAASRFSSSLPPGPGGAFAAHPVAAPLPAVPLPPQPEQPSAPPVAAMPAEQPTTSAPTSGNEPAAAQPAAEDADLPWWLSDVPRNPEPVRPPVLWPPAKSSTARQRLSEPQTARPERTEPRQLLDRETAEASASEPAAASGETQRSVGEDVSGSRSSRLSGLRNLLFVLGVKNQQGGEEADEPLAGSAPGSASNRQSYERTVVEAQENAQRNIGGASSRLVTAAPEFLPPKPVVLEFDKAADARVGESSTRQDRRASADGVDILPSKRGQYRKL